MLDCELSVKQHVTKVASSCFYHLRRLKQIRWLIGKEVTAQLVSAFILSHLDYCNALLAELPRATTQPLQRVQNAVARLVLNLRLRDHVTPALKQLHWLPVASHLLMHLIHTGRALQYLVNSVQSETLEIVWNNRLRQTYYMNKVRWTWLELLWPSSTELATISSSNNDWH